MIMSECIGASIFKVAVLVACLPCAWAATGNEDACSGRFGDSAVVDLCPSNWPGRRRADRLWLILFYAPWCGHCQDMQPNYVRLARTLAAEEGIGVGAIDCSNPDHHNLCRRYGIAGYPTLKAILAGKVVESYNGDRDTDELKQWILSVLQRQGGSARCPKGSVHTESAVVPLCQAHFPGRRAPARSAWLILYYEHRAGGLPDAVAQVAAELSGHAPRRAARSWREHLKEIGSRYGFRLRMPTNVPPGAKGTLAKVGAVCCDCANIGDVGLPCSSHATRPALMWADIGTEPRELLSAGRFVGAVLASKQRLMEAALEALGAYTRVQPNTAEL